MQQIARAKLPTKYGRFTIVVYRSIPDGREHTALILGKPKQRALVRIHSECLTGDTLFSLRCDCGIQLKKSFERLKRAGSGVLLYLGQEGRGIGLSAKIKAYALQDDGYDTIEANHALGLPADARNYKIAADMLGDLGLSEISLLTNNPDKEQQLSSYGIDIAKSIPLESAPNPSNRHYLRTKKQKMGHRLRKV